jgi:hypothetical protein
MAAPSACERFRAQMRRPSGSVTRTAPQANGSSSKRLQRRKMDSNNFVDLFTMPYELVRFSPRKEAGRNSGADVDAAAALAPRGNQSHDGLRMSEPITGVEPTKRRHATGCSSRSANREIGSIGTGLFVGSTPDSVGLIRNAPNFYRQQFLRMVAVRIPNLQRQWQNGCTRVARRIRRFIRGIDLYVIAVPIKFMADVL